MQTKPIEQDGTFVFHDVRPGEYFVCHTVSSEAPPESMESAVRVKAKSGGVYSVTLKPMGPR